MSITPEPITLRVKPLPISGKPDRFNNQVGDYRLILAAGGDGDREISLHIHDSNRLASVPDLLSGPEIGEQLIPLDVKTRSDGGTGREHILRY